MKEEADDYIEVFGAREHNLKNISLRIPRNKLVVLTGLSGSGKSSLAFDTIFAEGQRRYIESFSAYARQFLGSLERPEVDQITGLSPVISIEQKTTSKNPRSTVGTITEVYDFLRLLFARGSTPYSYVTGKEMVRYSDDQILDIILKDYSGEKVHILAPMVRGRKGHYRELFEQIIKQGFLRARIDGKVQELKARMQLDRYKIHNIEAVIDRLTIAPEGRERILQSLKTALKLGKGGMAIALQDSDDIRFFSRSLMCADSGIAYDDPAPNLFSFNSPFGACVQCSGLGVVAEPDIHKLIPNPRLSIKKGGIAALEGIKSNALMEQLQAIGERHGFTLDTPLEEISEDNIQIIFNGSNEMLKVHQKNSGNAFMMAFEGVCNFLLRQKDEWKSKTIDRWVESFMNQVPCPKCQGTRLKKEATFFKINQTNIAELSAKSIRDLHTWCLDVNTIATGRQGMVIHEVMKEIIPRLQFLLDVGLHYLTLNRPAQSLSGGEAQRIRLATQLGSQLVGVLYILDEPSIGLHQRDNERLINSLQNLRDSGNSVLVIEHDKEMMESADHLIDIGPGAGLHGGRIISEGHPSAIVPGQSITGDYLLGKREIPLPEFRRKGNGKFLRLFGATGHNLKHVNLEIPLGTLTVVTGVSGSGKSSLINQTLYPILNQYFYKSVAKPLPYHKIDGLKHLDKVIEIDQLPIGRTPRSNPATYTNVFSDIRNLFAELPESKIRGYKPGRFSFNVNGGRCETCQGGGLRVIEMNFLPDVYVHCETCQGKRYNRETLEIRYKGKSISDVLDMTIEDALAFFSSIPSITQKIKTLHDVGLGYLTLGQSSTTLSGGEAQRVKLATELAKRDTGNTFYILDEPSTGLHFEDIRIFLEVIKKLVDNGNTVLIIEHNLDIIKVADHIIEIGPDAGMDGGTITFAGPPEELASFEGSFTAPFLKKELHNHSFNQHA